MTERGESRSRRALAGSLAVAILVIGIVYGSKAASGADGYGYVSQADLWLDGNLRVSQPWVDDVPWPDAHWTFTPLGYRPVGETGDRAIVPTYSAGLPLLMAAAKLVGGHAAMFVVVPLTGALLVLATYGIGLRIDQPVAGLWAAALVAASPIVLLQLLQPMTDVPVAAAWACATYFVLGARRWESLAAGLMAAVAVLIRPNLFFLAAVLGSWYVIDAARIRAFREAVIRAVGFGATAAVGMAGVAAINAWLFGSPTTSGYGTLADNFAWARVPTNGAHYWTWLLDTQTLPGIIGVIALLVPHPALWPSTRARTFLIPAALTVLGVWLIYCAYLVFDNWTFLRFLLPTWPFMMLGTGAVIHALYRTRRIALRLVAMGVVVVALNAQLGFVAEHDILDLARSEARYPVVAKAVRGTTENDSVILAMQHSGTLRYYAGRLTLRYDLLESDWLDRAVAWFHERGIEVYLLIDDWERTPFEEHFAGQRALVNLDARARLVYQGPSDTTLFALSPGASVGKPIPVPAAEGPVLVRPAEERNPRLRY